MKVAIINTPKGHTEVHAHGCADVAKSEKRNKDEAWVIEVPSLVELSHTYWNDQIGDTVDPNSAEGWATAESWTGEFKVLPCAKALPFKVEAAEVDYSKGQAVLLKKMPSHGLCEHAQTPAARRKCRNARKAAAAN